MHAPIFRGFPTETFAFLQDLEDNNNKAWFEANRQQYLDFVLEPMKDLVSDLGTMILSIDPHFEVSPAVNKTISRIHRDTRFSRNKLPYRSVVWFIFKRPIKDWQEAPAYYFEISPSGYRYGMGMYSASPKTMEQFRALLDESPQDFLNAISFFPKQTTFGLEGEKYKKLLSLEKPPEIRDWYQRKTFYLFCEKPLDKIISSPGLLDVLKQDFSMVAPLYQWLLQLKK